MFIKEPHTIHLHQRESKLGKVHNFKRRRSAYHFRCDACDKEFVRDKSKVTPARASNSVLHVCSGCDPKKFAQKIGVKMRKVWQMDASSTEVKL